MEADADDPELVDDDEPQPPIDEYLLRIHGRRDAPPQLNPALSRGRESEHVPEHLEFVETGEVLRGQFRADREAVGEWVGQFAGEHVQVAVEACTGWLFVYEVLAGAGVMVHLAEPAEASALRSGDGTCRAKGGNFSGSPKTARLGRSGRAPPVGGRASERAATAIP